MSAGRSQLEKFKKRRKKKVANGAAATNGGTTDDDTSVSISAAPVESESSPKLATVCAFNLEP